MVISPVRQSLLTFVHNYVLLWNLLLFGLLLGLMYFWFPTTVGELRLRNTSSAGLTMPYTFSRDVAVYEIEGVLVKDFRPANHLTLRADDCVEFLAVDGVPVYDEPCGGCKHCTPFIVDLPKTLARGGHQLKIRVRNLGGLGFLDVRQAHGFGLAEGVVSLAVALAWLWVIRRRRMSMWAWWLVVAAMFLAFGYHFATDPWQRQYDADGHREYVDYVLAKHSLPQIGVQWESHQPPLYYLLSASWVGLGSQFAAIDTSRWLQVLAAVVYVATIALAVISWRKFPFPKQSAWLGLVLFSFLPAQVFLSARINNDVVMPLMGIGVTYLLWSYVRPGGSRVHLWLLSLVLALALAAKLTAMSYVAAAALIIWFKSRSERLPLMQSFRAVADAVLPGVGWIVLWGANSFEHTGELFFTNINHLNSGLGVPNTAYHFLSFDYRALLTEVYPNTWGGAIRESLPTFLVGSALFGEHSFAYLQYPWVSYLPAVFILLCFVLIVGWVTPPSKMWEHPWLVAVALVGVHAVYFMLFNWRYPYAPQQDARFWAPVFYPVAVLWSWGFEVCLNRLTGTARLLCKYSPVIFLAILGGFYFRLVVP